jgi:acyl-CoA thioester hydrolase
MQETRTTVRVIYADVDRMGVVHHGNYFRYFEQGRTEFLRQRGMSYAEVEASGVIMPIVEVQVRYLAPARYDDLLEVRVMLTELKHVSVTFEYELRRVGGDEKLLARGRTVLACCSAQGQPVRLPPVVRELLAREPLSSPAP